MADTLFPPPPYTDDTGIEGAIFHFDIWKFLKIVLILFITCAWGTAAGAASQAAGFAALNHGNGVVQEDPSCVSHCTTVVSDQAKYSAYYDAIHDGIVALREERYSRLI